MSGVSVGVVWGTFSRLVWLTDHHSVLDEEDHVMLTSSAPRCEADPLGGDVACCFIYYLLFGISSSIFIPIFYYYCKNHCLIFFQFFIKESIVWQLSLMLQESR